jgi:hypothetical protein
VDYYHWALQRFYERSEERFLDLIWPQVSEIHDLDRLENGRRGVFYTKQKPLNLAALEKKKGPGIYGPRIETRRPHGMTPNFVPGLIRIVGKCPGFCNNQLLAALLRTFLVARRGAR